MPNKHLKEQKVAEIPSIIVEFDKQPSKDKTTSPNAVVTEKISSDTATSKQVKTKYQKLRYLGKGGYARCYEVLKQDTSNIYACKAVSKAQVLHKPRNKAKIVSEIRIHRSLDHPGVVKFHHCFEDRDFVYILLELCPNKTLKELLSVRKQLTIFEVQYLLYHILSAISFIHNRNVIHRDIKLANILINPSNHPKLGDFGLAAQLESSNELKTTMCGTPNYIAPEILSTAKNGHGKAVDIWSLGVLAFALLIGHPPFETSKIKVTYKKIQYNDYTIPASFTAQFPDATDLIKKMLCNNPLTRLSASNCLSHAFFDSFYASFNNNVQLTNNYCLPNCIYRRVPLLNEIKVNNINSVCLKCYKIDSNEFNNRKHYKEENEKNDKAKQFEMKVNIGFNKEILNKLFKNKNINFSFFDFIKRTVSIDSFIDYTSRYGWGFSLNINLELETLSTRFKDLFSFIKFNYTQEELNKLLKYAGSLKETVCCFFNDDSSMVYSADKVMYGPSVHDEINSEFNKKFENEEDYILQSEKVTLNKMEEVVHKNEKKLIEAEIKIKDNGEKESFYFFLLKNYPLKLKKKTLLLKHFKQLLQSEESCVENFEVFAEEVIGTEHGPIFLLSNGNLVAKFKDGSQVLMSIFKNKERKEEKELAWVVFIDKEDRRFEVVTNFKEDLINIQADKPSLYRRIRFCLQFYNK